MGIGPRQNAAQRVIDCNLPARRQKAREKAQLYNDQRNKQDCEHRSLHLSRIGELYWNCPRYCLTSMRSLRRVRERNGAVRVHARERKRDALPKPARGTRSSSIQRPIKDSRRVLSTTSGGRETDISGGVRGGGLLVDFSGGGVGVDNQQGGFGPG